MYGDNKPRLNEIQSEIDNHMAKYIEDDFKLKLAHDKTLKPFLTERDKIIAGFSKEQKKEFYNSIVQNFEALAEFFPVKADGTSDLSFIKSFVAEYVEPYKMRVAMELYENEYIENQKLEKIINLFDEEPELTKIIWKNEKGSCLMFDFFENSDDDFEAFDIFYEFYIDMLFFANFDLE